MASVTDFIICFLFCKINSAWSSDLVASCRLMHSCVLPCSVQGQLDMIHWTQTPGDYNVHTYVEHRDKLTNQRPRFTNRTSLFVEEFSRGNASLLLSEVKVQDQGRYRCSTSSSSGVQSSFVELRAYAPVREVFLEAEGEELQCISRDVYPKPTLTWDPSTEHNTTVSETENGLYNINSSVRFSEKQYSCNVSTKYDWRRAVLIVKDEEFHLSELTSDQEGLYSCLHHTDAHTETVFIRIQIKRPKFVLMVLLWSSLTLGWLLFFISLPIFLTARKKLIKSVNDLKQMLRQTDFREMNPTTDSNGAPEEPQEQETSNQNQALDPEVQDRDEDHTPENLQPSPPALRSSPASGRVHEDLHSQASHESDADEVGTEPPNHEEVPLTSIHKSKISTCKTKRD